MKESKKKVQLDAYTGIGDLASKARRGVGKMLLPLALLGIAETAYLGVSGKAGADAFGAMAIGTWVALAVWSRSSIGLPILPMMAVQALLIYGVPIVAGHEVIFNYPPDYLSRSGVEIMFFQLSMVGCWSVAMRLSRPSPPMSHTLHEFTKSGRKGWSRLGIGIISAVTGFEILQGLNAFGGALSLLPNGSESIITALLGVANACGFFLVALIVGSKEAGAAEQAYFWLLVIANAMISSEDFILASAAASLMSIAVGLFCGSGRVPWRYLIVTMLLLSFFNSGKVTMRERYWENEDAPGSQITITQLPAVYLEWIGASYDAFVENNTHSRKEAAYTDAGPEKHQTLLDRIDNLQNLLFVMDAMENEHVRPLHGQTYSLIPPLLIPRVFWPNKPRSHEGQILLNVHFGRQDLESTFTTYIAWGLVPEAFGNFGPYLGSLAIGGFLGALFGWIENLTARKLVVSAEGFLSLALVMNLMNSFEMVASVLVTCTFQSLMVVLAACMPFVRKARNPVRPEEPE
jgi:hypothetical protein